MRASLLPPLLLSCITHTISPSCFQASLLFFLLCSSRVVLSGPVLPEMPRHISSFCVLSFPFQASLFLSVLFIHLFLYLTFSLSCRSSSHTIPRDRNGSILVQYLVFVRLRLGFKNDPDSFFLVSPERKEKKSFSTTKVFFLISLY